MENEYDNNFMDAHRVRFVNPTRTVKEDRVALASPDYRVEPCSLETPHTEERAMAKIIISNDWDV